MHAKVLQFNQKRKPTTINEQRLMRCIRLRAQLNESWKMLKKQELQLIRLERICEREEKALGVRLAEICEEAE